MPAIRSRLVTAAAVGAAVVGGGAIANAASSGSSSGSTSTSATPAPPGQGAPAFDPKRGGHTLNGKTETLLTGDTEAKVRAAALAKVSGTVERVETNVDDSVPYEAHIRKADGSEVVVEVNSDYTVASVKAMGPGSMGGPRGSAGSGGAAGVPAPPAQQAA
jgi:hypothetical protein